MSQRVTWSESQYREWLRRASTPQSAVPTLGTNKKVSTGLLPPQKRASKTRVEIDFEVRLKTDWPQMTILFEMVKLKIDERCWYTPDFFIPQLLTFFEVKGPYVREDSLIKFKAARVIHNWAVFQMWQKKDGIWERIH